jgi:ubiquinol-cytochrome c reductase cytochrome c subunit
VVGERASRVGGVFNLECAMKLPVAFALIASLSVGAASAQDEGPRGNAQTGKQLFESKGCYSCHGFVGQGSREGPRLAPPLAFGAFVLQLRTPRTIMPPYKETLVSDQQAADMIAYLASVPKPPDPKSIKLLQ